MADLEKAWNRVLDRGSKKAIANLKNVHANNPRFQELLKNRGEEGGSPSAAAAKKVKVEPRKTVAINPTSVRALNAARQQAYMAKGGRQPIGAMGSGGSNVMAGGGQSTIKDLKASIKAGFNPKVSLDPYESERAKKVGPRSLKMKNEEVQIDEALSPERKRMFDLKLKLIKKVANKKAYTKPSKIDAPRNELNPSKDMRLEPKSMPTVAVGHYKEEVQIDEVTKKEAESMLGGPVKDKPKMPPGKKPAGYRYVRSLARKAMKKGMKEEVEVVEAVKDAADVGEYDYEGDMAKSQLRSIMANSKRMHDMLEENTNLPEWVQSKITLAEDYIVTAANYMEGEMNEEVESVNEGATHWEYSGTVNGKDYTITVPRGADLSDHLGHKKIQRENPHLEPHEVKAVADTSGEDEEHVEVEHGGKKYTHRVTNNQEPRMVYGEEVEHVTEKYMGFAKLKASIAARGGARDPAAVAAAIGRKKYGKEKFQAMAAAGKRHANEEFEQIDEQSPAEIKAKYYHDQFDKVKPVKAYDKEGKLVGQYRSMAHAKQMKPGHTYKMAEEVVTEAEGKVAVTPKEKELAAHHGDKTKITYGDVIKARIKSSKEKLMKGKE